MKIKCWILISMAALLFLFVVSCSPDQKGGDEAEIVGSETLGERNVDNNAENSEKFLDISGINTVEQLSPLDGAGAKPLFEWIPVEGAESYSLLLQTEAGEAYWVWSGSSTTVYLGGTESQPQENAAGPTLYSSMLWTVTAFDEEMEVIASSPLRPISP